MSDRGVFTLSLDTELAWGTFDLGNLDRHADAYRATSEVVDRLCALLDRYEVPATWALVAHLLRDCRDGDCCTDWPAPDYPWIDDWFGSLPCRTGVDPELWYAPTLLDRITDTAVAHDIGLHGDTHMILGEPGCSAAAAEAELDRAVATLRDAGIEPRSFVYPRNSVGHREALRSAGIEVYRERDARSYERASLPSAGRKLCRYLDEALSLRPPVVTPRRVDGLVAVPGSQVFRPHHGGWQWTLPRSQVRRAHAGLERAAETGGVFHLWFHPFNLGRDPGRLLGLLSAILQRVTQLRAAGRLEVLTLAGIADEFEAGRWGSPE